MNYNTFIGIDPGQDGGISVITPGGTYVRCLPISNNILDGLNLHGWLETLTIYFPQQVAPVAYVEKVGAMPGQGVVSMWKFGYGVGQIHMFLQMLHIPMKLVTPQAWKKLILAGSDKSKQAAIDYCLRAYPDIRLFASDRSKKHHDGMAESLLIAEYAMRKERDGTGSA